MEVQQINLSKPKQDQLRKWLDGDGFGVFIEVLESRVFEHEAAAANSYSQGTSGNDSLAKDSQLKAALFRQMIEILVELRERKEPFKTLTATPTTIHIP
jgi:hypothetical protein